jgi:hypothetical protein
MEKGKMNVSLKGALWSGFIFPGLGQIALKHYKRGAVLMLTVLVGLSVVVVKAVQHTLVVLEKLELEGAAISMNAISNVVTHTSSTSESLIFNLALLLIMFCWIIGTVDAYRIGRKEDIEKRFANQGSNGNRN